MLTGIQRNLDRAFFLALALSCTVTAFAAKFDKTAKSLAVKVNAQLPKGWSAKYSPDDQWIEVHRKGEVDFLPGPANDRPQGQSYRDEFYLFYAVATAVSEDQYRRDLSGNKEMARLQDEARRKLAQQGVPFLEGKYVPRNERERELVRSYDMFASAQPDLPTHFYRDISVTRYNPATLSSIVADETLRKECAAVEEKILSLLTPYPQR